MKTIELTEDEIRIVDTCIENYIDSLRHALPNDDFNGLKNARHKLFMSLMDSPVSGDTKFIEDGKQHQFLRDELIKVRNSCLGPVIFDAEGAVLLSHTIRWLSFKIEGKPYEQPTD